MGTGLAVGGHLGPVVGLVRTRFVPMFTIGSTAITKPGTSRKSPLPRRSWLLTKVRHLGVFVHLAADPVTDERLDDRETCVS